MAPSHSFVYYKGGAGGVDGAGGADATVAAQYDAATNGFVGVLGSLYSHVGELASAEYTHVQSVTSTWIVQSVVCLKHTVPLVGGSPGTGCGVLR